MSLAVGADHRCNISPSPIVIPSVAGIQRRKLLHELLLVVISCAMRPVLNRLRNTAASCTMLPLVKGAKELLGDMQACISTYVHAKRSWQSQAMCPERCLMKLSRATGD